MESQIPIKGILSFLNYIIIRTAADIKTRPPSITISFSKNKNGSGLFRNILVV